MHSKRDAGNRLDPTQLDRLIHVHFPRAHGGGQIMSIEQIGANRARLRIKLDECIVAPGGILSGPSMFALADIGLRVVLLAELGAAARLAVATSVTISFPVPAGPADVVCEARLLKRGRRLAVGEVELYTDGGAGPIAHATVSYALAVGMDI